MAGAECTGLIWAPDPVHRHAFGSEKGSAAVEVIFIIYLEAQVPGLGMGGLCQDDAMMSAFSIARG